jgi:hypothetical protein
VLYAQQPAPDAAAGSSSEGASASDDDIVDAEIIDEDEAK